MLVCSVVLRPQRGALAATILETATAIDAPTTNAVFAILADDNASASDHLDGFVGQMMVEAASAAEAVNAGSIRNGSIVEETNAVALFDGAAPRVIAASVAESATADSVQFVTYSAAVAETATAADVVDADTVSVSSAVLDGVFVDASPPSTLLGTDVPDSGPVTVFD